VQKPLNICN